MGRFFKLVNSLLVTVFSIRRINLRFVTVGAIYVLFGLILTIAMAVFGWYSNRDTPLRFDAALLRHPEQPWVWYQRKSALHASVLVDALTSRRYLDPFSSNSAYTDYPSSILQIATKDVPIPCWCRSSSLAEIPLDQEEMPVVWAERCYGLLLPILSSSRWEFEPSRRIITRDELGFVTDINAGWGLPLRIDVSNVICSSICFATALLAFKWTYVSLLRRLRVYRLRCSNCGYHVKNISSTKCPECGAQIISAIAKTENQ